MNCFRCGTIMGINVGNGVVLDVCPECGGAWASSEELQALRERLSLASRSVLLRQACEERASERKHPVTYRGMCPVAGCGGRMWDVSRFGECLDQCQTCGGLFFDRGELQACVQAEAEQESILGALWNAIKRNMP